MALLRLPAPALRGTFAKAYALLTRLVSQIGWDELLKCRSSVFVMEEEYRMQKATQDVTPTSERPVDIGGEADGRTGHQVGAADDASIQGIAPSDGDTDGEAVNNVASKAPSAEPASHEVEGGAQKKMVDAGETDSEDEDAQQGTIGGLRATNHPNASSQSIPTIKISSESDHEREKLELQRYMNGQKNGEAEEGTVHEAQAKLSELMEGEPVHVDLPTLERPAQAQAGRAHERTDSEAIGAMGETNGAIAATGEADAASGGVEAQGQQQQQQQQQPQQPQETGFSFTNKRLCERWLDNLFMVLYEVSNESGRLDLVRFTPLMFCVFGCWRRTCACTRSGAPRLRTTRRSRWRTARRVRSGRSSAS